MFRFIHKDEIPDFGDDQSIWGSLKEIADQQVTINPSGGDVSQGTEMGKTTKAFFEKAISEMNKTDQELARRILDAASKFK